MSLVSPLAILLNRDSMAPSNTHIYIPAKACPSKACQPANPNFGRFTNSTRPTLHLFMFLQQAQSTAAICSSQRPVHSGVNWECCFLSRSSNARNCRTGSNHNAVCYWPRKRVSSVSTQRSRQTHVCLQFVNNYFANCLHKVWDQHDQVHPWLHCSEMLQHLSQKPRRSFPQHWPLSIELPITKWDRPPIRLILTLTHMFVLCRQAGIAGSSVGSAAAFSQVASLPFRTQATPILNAAPPMQFFAGQQPQPSGWAWREIVKARNLKSSDNFRLLLGCHTNQCGGQAKECVQQLFTVFSITCPTNFGLHPSFSNPGQI